jgi:hypothetical protein
MTFAPIITVNANNPALVVTIADPGVPGVTYQQVKNSLGQYVYMLQGFYLQALSIKQLVGAIKYLRYDADGNQLVTNITTTVDPYQDQKAIVVDLANFESDIIFNGNSTVQTDIYPFEQLQIKLYMRRITSSFGRNLQNFLVQEKIAHQPRFFDNYGNLFRIAQDNFLAQESATLGQNIQPEITAHRIAVDETGDETAIAKKPKTAIVCESPEQGMIFLVLAAASFVGYMAQKE